MDSRGGGGAGGAPAHRRWRGDARRAPRAGDRLGLAERVVFTGYVPEAEKTDVFNLADVFFFPSAMEGFGLTVAEAMASGLAVVASDRGRFRSESIPEVVADGESGFVCDPERPESFVARLVTLLRDPALRGRFGAAGRERADRLYRWERCVDGTRRVYETAVEAWRRQRAAARR